MHENNKGFYCESFSNLWHKSSRANIFITPTGGDNLTMYSYLYGEDLLLM